MNQNNCPTPPNKFSNNNANNGFSTSFSGGGNPRPQYQGNANFRGGGPGYKTWNNNKGGGSFSGNNFKFKGNNVSMLPKLMDRLECLDRKLGVLKKYLELDMNPDSIIPLTPIKPEEIKKEEVKVAQVPDRIENAELDEIFGSILPSEPVQPAEKREVVILSQERDLLEAMQTEPEPELPIDLLDDLEGLEGLLDEPETQIPKIDQEASNIDLTSLQYFTSLAKHLKSLPPSTLIPFSSLSQFAACMTFLECANYKFSCVCKESCTYCNNHEINSDSMHKILTEIFEVTPSKEWTCNAFQLAVFKFARFETEKSLLTLPNVINRISKQYKKQKEKIPVLMKIVRSKTFLHCVLLVAEIQNTEDGYRLTLTDGHFFIRSELITDSEEEITNNGLISKLIAKGKIQVGHKLHLIHAELVESEEKDGNPLFEGVTQLDLQLNYNGLQLAPRNTKLGLQKKSFLHKKLSTLSSFSGTVSLIDFVVRKVSNLKTMKGINNTKNINFKLTVVDSYERAKGKSISLEFIAKNCTMEVFKQFEAKGRYIIQKLVPVEFSDDSLCFLLHPTTKIHRMIEAPSTNKK